MTQGSNKTPIVRDPTDLRAAAALFAMEEVDSLLNKLNEAQGSLQDEIKTQTEAAVALGFANLSETQERIIYQALVRLKIKTNQPPPNRYSDPWVIMVGLAGVFAGCAIGVVIGRLI